MTPRFRVSGRSCAKHGDYTTLTQTRRIYVHAALRSSFPNRDSVKLVVSYRKKLRFRDNLGYAITIYLEDDLGSQTGPDPRVEKDENISKNMDRRFINRQLAISAVKIPDSNCRDNDNVTWSLIIIFGKRTDRCALDAMLKCTGKLIDKQIKISV